MPELPEVQTMVDDLIGAGLVGAVIRDAQVSWESTIALGPAEDFCIQVQNLKIIRIYRRAKYLVFELDGGLSLIVHMRMTGRFIIGAMGGEVGRHVHVVLVMDNQLQLMFHDTRKFGRFYLTPSPMEILGRLGPEPLSGNFTAKVLSQGLRHRRRQIKPLLLDQHFVAGIGNIYADEALWRAKIHPLRPAHTLTKGEITALHRAIRFVLRQGLRNGGTSLGRGKGNFKSAYRGRGRNANQLQVFRRTGQPCPRCGQSIEKAVIAQRATHYCKICQTSSG